MIKKKDGSTYEIRKPVPLTKAQVYWKKEDLIFHNFNWKKETVKSTKTLLNPIKANKIEEVIKEETPKFTEPIKKEPPAKKITLNNKVVFHCLPAKTKEITDDFYGEKYTKTIYLDKITFEAIFIDNNGLEMSFWSNVNIGINSIVYPSKYVNNSERLDEFQWWKVVSIENKSNGFIYSSVVSNNQPDFSD